MWDYGFLEHDHLRGGEGPNPISVSRRWALKGRRLSVSLERQTVRFGEWDKTGKRGPPSFLLAFVS